MTLKRGIMRAALSEERLADRDPRSKTIVETIVVGSIEERGLRGFGKYTRISSSNRFFARTVSGKVV